MSDQESLFGDLLDEGHDSAVPEPGVPELPRWRVDMLRATLDKRGLSSMPERQSPVEAVVGRDVANLRELTLAESRTVLEALSIRGRERTTSSRDDREGDTWIDRL